MRKRGLHHPKRMCLSCVQSLEISVKKKKQKTKNKKQKQKTKILTQETVVCSKN
jgi:hypothetical protein